MSASAITVIPDLGALYALYLTGLYKAAEHNEFIHAALHMHMFLAGCLLSWAVIGINPVRRRPGIPVRLAALVIVGAGHDTLSMLMYAHNLPAGGGSIADRHMGAELMYYGGTIIDVALAIILMMQWYQSTGRELARSARRSTSQQQVTRKSTPDQAVTSSLADVPPAPGPGEPTAAQPQPNRPLASRFRYRAICNGSS